MVELKTKQKEWGKHDHAHHDHEPLSEENGKTMVGVDSVKIENAQSFASDGEMKKKNKEKTISVVMAYIQCIAGAVRIGHHISRCSISVRVSAMRWAPNDVVQLMPSLRHRFLLHCVYSGDGEGGGVGGAAVAALH